MAVNIHIEKTGTENSASVMRKFTRRMQSSGIVRHMRDKRYFARDLSKAALKKRKMRKLERSEEFENLIKQGVLSDQVRGRRVKWRKK